MPYLEIEQVQAWLQDTKYPVSHIDETFEAQASGIVLGKLAQRYDTSTWTNATNTPSLAITAMSMLVAAYFMRMMASEEDGRTSHADWLEERAMTLCAGIVDGCIDLPGVDPSASTSLGGGPLFWPTDAATTLADVFPQDVNAAPLRFSMGMIF